MTATRPRRPITTVDPAELEPPRRRWRDRLRRRGEAPAVDPPTEVRETLAPVELRDPGPPEPDPADPDPVRPEEVEEAPDPGRAGPAARHPDPEAAEPGAPRLQVLVPPSALPPSSVPPGLEPPSAEPPAPEPPGPHAPSAEPVEDPQGAGPPAPVLPGPVPAPDPATTPTPEPAGPPIHHRIAERIAELAEARRRIRVRRRTVVLALLVVCTLAVASLFSPFVDLDRIEVDGLDGEPADLVRRSTGLEPGTALFAVNPAAVRAAVESLPWVSHARVEVRWPDAVDVGVTAQRPVALLGVGDEPAVLMAFATGATAELDDVGPLLGFAEAVPTLRVDPELAPRRGRLPDEVSSAVQALDHLRPATARNFDAASLSEDGSLTLVAVTGPLEGATVVMGALDDMPAKLEAAEAALSGSIDLTCLDRIDVSVPSRLTISRREGCELPPLPEQGT